MEAAQLQAVLDRRGIRFCYIGGIALQCWGQQRYTQDLDLRAAEFAAELVAAGRLAHDLPHLNG